MNEQPRNQPERLSDSEVAPRVSPEDPAPLRPLVTPGGTPDQGKVPPKRKKGVVVAVILAVVVVLGAGVAALYVF